MCVLLLSGETWNYISAQMERSRLRDRSGRGHLAHRTKGGEGVGNDVTTSQSGPCLPGGSP